MTKSSRGIILTLCSTDGGVLSHVGLQTLYARHVYWSSRESECEIDHYSLEIASTFAVNIPKALLYILDVRDTCIVSEY